STFHFKEGAPLLVASTLDQAAVYYPFEHAAAVMNLVVCSAEPTFFDATRVESIIRRFNPVAVFGVRKAMLDGLEALGHSIEELFFERVAFAYPDGCDRLSRSGTAVLRRWVEIGPALAIECARGGGLHYDHREWKIDDSDGELRLTSKMPRAL